MEFKNSLIYSGLMILASSFCYADEAARLESKLVNYNITVEREFPLDESGRNAVIKFTFNDYLFLDFIEIHESKNNKSRDKRLLLSEKFHEMSQDFKFNGVLHNEDLRGIEFYDMDGDGYTDIELIGIAGSGSSVTFFWYFNPKIDQYEKKEKHSNWWFDKESQTYKSTEYFR